MYNLDIPNSFPSRETIPSEALRPHRTRSISPAGGGRKFPAATPGQASTVPPPAFACQCENTARDCISEQMIDGIFRLMTCWPGSMHHSTHRPACYSSDFSQALPPCEHESFEIFRPHVTDPADAHAGEITRCSSRSAVGSPMLSLSAISTAVNSRSGMLGLRWLPSPRTLMDAPRIHFQMTASSRMGHLLGWP